MFRWLRKFFGRPERAPLLATDTSPGGIYSDLRQRALAVRRSEAGIPDPPAHAPVWGLLMEIGAGGGTATLLALSDGTTSLYFSSGGGIIGGHGHDAVREANTALILTANQLREHLTPASSFPLPQPRCTIFYALTDRAILTGGAVDHDLGENRHPLSPLFHAGHGVLTELRLLSQRAEQTPGSNS